MDNLTSFFLQLSVWGIIKVAVIFALLLYLVFAGVVVRQVFLMTKVVSGGIDFFVKVMAWLHLIFAVAVIVLAIIIL